MIRAIRGIALAIGAVAAAALAAAPATAKPAKPLFAADDPIHITITGPIGHLRAARTDSDTVDGTLAVAGGAPLAIKLTARGITRRRADVCQFPPLRVEFVAKPPADSLFAGQKKLKLVTHCQTSADFQKYPLLEYAAYRLYNTLTPQSFRARLATVDYVDVGGKPLSRVGIFIEDASDVAKRNDLEHAKVGARIKVVQLDPAATARLDVFEYMIGNLDWATNGGPEGTDCCHNTRLIAPPGATTSLIPVPYDFDFSGLVDAPYAGPPDGIDVPNVRTRLFRGFCRHNDATQAAAADFLAKRATLLAVLDGIPQLDDKSRKKAQAYLAGFFDKIADSNAVSANLLKTCL